MDNPEVDDDPKAVADREKFESISKVVTHPVIVRGSRGKRTLKVPELKSPDELNLKWHDDPEEIRAAKRAAARKEKRNSKPQD